MSEHSELLNALKSGDRKALARAITIVENELDGFEEILFNLSPDTHVPVIGFTGPPGAGKSTLINRLLQRLSVAGKKVAVIAVDPTSPFNYGSLLGDRLRMSEHFTHPGIFIRSIATRGSLGGLSEKILEITDVLRAADFSLILIETVGVGQSEVEIAGLADTTVVVFVPESGDEIQSLKSGIMEIADIFVVNKCDRDGADALVNHLQRISARKDSREAIPVIKTSATEDRGIEELLDAISAQQISAKSNEKRLFLLTEKAFRLIQVKRMNNVNRSDLKEALKKSFGEPTFNLYKFAHSYILP